MKIIISHDVDHLHGKEHWFRDLIYPKLWVRETLRLFRGAIAIQEWFYRCISCFYKKRNYIPEVMAFEKKNEIPSTFFFGMNQGLGMSYKPREAKAMIQHVKNSGFDVGVHGICYDNQDGICKERTTFTDLMGFPPDGIRMHYVRFNEKTFSYLNDAGYSFDSTEFNKSTGLCVKNPHKVEEMWEFPVCIMDTYLPYNLKQAKEKTIFALNEGRKDNISYFTVLLHDSHYGKEYPIYKQWYEWLIELLSNESDVSFVSFKQAIEELEAQNG